MKRLRKKLVWLFIINFCARFTLHCENKDVKNNVTFIYSYTNYTVALKYSRKRSLYSITFETEQKHKHEHRWPIRETTQHYTLHNPYKLVEITGKRGSLLVCCYVNSGACDRGGVFLTWQIFKETVLKEQNSNWPFVEAWGVQQIAGFLNTFSKETHKQGNYLTYFYCKAT